MCALCTRNHQFTSVIPSDSEPVSLSQHTRDSRHLLMVMTLLHGPLPALLIARTYVIKTALQSNIWTRFLVSKITLICIASCGIWILMMRKLMLLSTGIVMKLPLLKVNITSYPVISPFGSSGSSHTTTSQNALTFTGGPGTGGGTIYSERSVAIHLVKRWVIYRICLLMNGLSLAIHYIPECQAKSWNLNPYPIICMP